VFVPFAESYGLDRKMALKLSSGLGSGMSCAETCGAVSGAVLVISLKHGHTEGHDVATRNACFAKVQEFLRIFKDRNKGQILCRNILDCDIFTPEGLRKAMDEELFTVVCTEMVVSAATILEELGY
jgi:C_GCAxxG_C_C family probable redox protein